MGPAADLWALGALLFRITSGYPAFPEDDAEQLVELVCAEPAAFAEDSGVLRPVIESLLRADPVQRPEAGEVRRWLGSLLRDAPEPPELEPAEPGPGTSRLPVLRVRGHLVRRPPRRAGALSRRHRRPAAAGRLPRRVLLPAAGVALSAVVVIGVMEALPGTRQSPQGARSQGGPGTTVPESPAGVGPSSAPSYGSAGYTMRRHDGFQVAVPDGWSLRKGSAAGTVSYGQHGFALTIAPGRDRLRGGEDLLAFQAREPELAAFRADPGRRAERVQLTTIGTGPPTAQGDYWWTNASGIPLFARNRAVVINDRVHLLLVSGPSTSEERVSEVYEHAVATYRVAARSP
ncbi:MAG TPA: hypothetical protein VN520_04625 [Streptomyces sp.]|uniref:hypothetical protein n=1 Tax=Streptomyces sp. TaxID=1931 RepID=UPI002CEDC777|nr:hypothetical protein [Streptomyces sp.]HWU05674.1 hypothetical protein [Streptomyces sp.]